MGGGFGLCLVGSAGAIASEPFQTSACHPAFEETFKTLDVSPTGPGTRWIAHTPWFGDFGDATFTDPGPNSPFSTGEDGLTITAAKDPTGHWRSGLLSSTDPRGDGFAATFGYFEMVASFPPGEGTWPAFWLATADRKAVPEVEIDAIEYLGKFPGRFQSTVTVRPDVRSTAGRSATTFINVPSGSLVSGPHAYGVSVGHKDVVFFLDRREVWRTPTPPELTKPLGILLNLGLGSGWPIDKTPNPSKMVVSKVAYYPDLQACGVSAVDAGDQ